MSASTDVASSSDMRSNTSSNSTLDDFRDDTRDAAKVTIHVKGIKCSVPAPDLVDDDTAFIESNDVTERIALLQNYLKHDTLYLPSQATRELVAWRAENRSNRLVPKHAPEGSDPAILTIIAVISTDGFFLTPDAYYKGSTQLTPSLADVKMSCLLRRPLDTNLSSDFTSGLTNLLWLMEQVRTPGFPRVGVAMPVGSSTPVMIKLRHVLFKVRRSVMIPFTVINCGSQEKDNTTIPLSDGIYHVFSLCSD